MVSTMVDTRVDVVNEADAEIVLFCGDTIVEVGMVLVVAKDELLRKTNELLLDGVILELEESELDTVETKDVENTEVTVESEAYVLKDVVPFLLKVEVSGHQVVYIVVSSVTVVCNAEEVPEPAIMTDEFSGLVRVEDEFVYIADV